MDNSIQVAVKINWTRQDNGIK